MSEALASASSTPSAEPKVESSPASSPPSSVGEHKSPIEKELAASKEKEQRSATESQAKEPTPQEKPKYKMKVQGREVEYDIDTIIRKAQMAEAADHKFQEAAQARKQIEQFVQMLQSDPMSVLTHPDLGINFEDLATSYLGDKYRKDLMDPMERELEELREFKRKQEETAQERGQREAQEAKERKFAQMKARAAAEYDRKISEVLSKADLPKTPHAVKRVAEVMLSAQKKGYDLDVETAVDMVRESYLTEVQALFGKLDGDALFKVLGGDLAKKIRKHDLDRLRSKMEGSQSTPQVPQQPAQPEAANRPKQPSQQKLSPDEWREMLRRKAGL